MASITIDGLDEEVFRRNIEAMLRVGEADRAAVKLRALLEPYAGDGRILPGRFLEVTAADIRLEGWDKLGESLARNDLPRNPISALTIAVSDAEAMGIEPGPDDDVGPLIATSHFTDEAYMFSQCAVSDLLDGYSFYGCEWHGSSAHMDNALSLGGVEDLYRAVARLEADLISSPQPAADMIRAGSLASCYLAVLLYQAVRDTIRAYGLPRPLCVMAGNEGIYPYFDAPVIGSAECIELGLVNGRAEGAATEIEREAETEDESAEAAEEEADSGIAYSRLGGMTGRKGEKKMVLELAEADVRSAAELLDRAGEDRMGEEPIGRDDRATPVDLLAQRGPSHPLFPVEQASSGGPFDPPPVDPAPAEPFAGRQPEPAGVDPFARAGSFPELAEADAWRLSLAKLDTGGALRADPEVARDALAPAPKKSDRPEFDEPESDRPESDRPESDRMAYAEPVRALPSHNLRARLSDAPPPSPRRPARWKVAGATLLRWLHAIFG